MNTELADHPCFGRCACGHEGLVHAGLTDFCSAAGCQCAGFHNDAAPAPSPADDRSLLDDDQVYDDSSPDEADEPIPYAVAGQVLKDGPPRYDRRDSAIDVLDPWREQAEATRLLQSKLGSLAQTVEQMSTKIDDLTNRVIWFEKIIPTINIGDCVCCEREMVVTYFDGEAYLCLDWRDCQAEQERIHPGSTELSHERDQGAVRVGRSSDPGDDGGPGRTPARQGDDVPAEPGPGDAGGAGERAGTDDALDR